jgi:cyclopropane fatty-acyl-phospholipid synthase-like methyltransferase
MNKSQNNKYIGGELQVFEKALIWKNYYASFIMPLLGKEVAEIGAGIGGTTKVLCDGTQDRWICVEPDGELASEIERKIDTGELPSVCKVWTGFARELQQEFDSILYIDVIEHIEDDKAELETAASLLKKGGRLFVIVPAHQSLYSPFDQHIGHYRRYSRKTLQAVVPPSFIIEDVKYLDSAGYTASLANKLFLKQSLPTLQQVLFWDRIIVPVSRISDRLTRFNWGKSILLTAKKK